MNKEERRKELLKQLNDLDSEPVIYGYARVSTKTQADSGNGLEVQRKALKDSGAEIIYEDVCTGTKLDRPEFDKMLEKLKAGDTLVVMKLDRFARTASQGAELIQSLLAKGVKVHVLNMGLIDNSPTGKLMVTMMLAFAEFERDLIADRMQSGREVARQNPDYKEGRPRKFTDAQLSHAMELLKTHTVNEVVNMTGISKSTLMRVKKNPDNFK